MRPRSYRGFIADLRGYRPALTVAVSAVVVAPSFLAFVHQDLSALQVLVRFAESLVVVGVLVWGATGVLVRYARTQAQVDKRQAYEDEMMR